jgi:undecaprenyl diphosphate synthase
VAFFDDGRACKILLILKEQTHLTTQTPPQHIGIIMDGNRRWAKKRFLPSALGHAAGAKQVRDIVEACIRAKVPHLSLFAFSTENWRRPEEEVSVLMGLFASYLQKEVNAMEANGVRLKVVGDKSKFSLELQELIRRAELQTQHNRNITLRVAANYGGRWDMLQAAKAWQRANPGADIAALTEESLAAHLSTADAPEMDLMIRTGGESRISNFMLWQAAYAEMFFIDTLWPDFSVKQFHEALEWFSKRDRRFGSAAPF